MSPGQSSNVLCIILSISSVLAVEMTVDKSGKCRHTETIFNCSGIGLFDIPAAEEIPIQIETLDVSNNHIRNISLINRHTLGKSLSSLNLSNNHVSVIQENTFNDFTHLVFLDLSNNLISGRSLNDMVFTDLRKLLHLILRGNPLRLVQKDTFSFMELPELAHLDLSHCGISELEIDSFDVRSLEYLDLSWNQLQTFKKGAFRMLPALKILDLSHNRISVLNEIPYMPELVTWILDSNGMETIEIRDDVEDYADNLQELYLRDNDILRFNEDSLPLKLDDLKVVDMSNNRLHCDCRMRWIVSRDNDFQKKNYTFTCSYPSKVSGRNLITLAPEELTCGTPLVKILFVVLLCVLVVIAFSGLVFFVIRNRRRRKRRKRAARGDDGGDYVIVYSRDDDDDDTRVTMSDNKQLLKTDINREFDV
ncbi:slit homolog 2 protein-like [Mercenaria mercenaria]|uniref:slit homolog 2 protein-like n=1 Tax=Mercenaria mercenaria TaxID=6596 RepID=UPI00234E806C|nr:slit homolog 2 protein-like [Mercenaria mercenaria]